MTIAEHVRYAVKEGLTPGDARILLAHVIKKDATYLDTHPEQKLEHDEMTSYWRAIRKRREGYSVATIIGRKAFYGADFTVNEHTLIPRPESELLVEKALMFLESKKRARVLDMGTGSGNLIISIALHSPKGRYTFTATDISESALTVARANAKKMSARVRFIHSNLFSNIPRRAYDLIIANLPYLTTEQLKEPSIRKEPVGALWGGAKGTEIYERFLEGASRYLAKDALILIEIDPSQKNELIELVLFHLPEAAVTISKDLSGRYRVLAIRQTPSI